MKKVMPDEVVDLLLEHLPGTHVVVVVPTGIAATFPATQVAPVLAAALYGACGDDEAEAVHVLAKTIANIKKRERSRAS